MSRLDEIRLDFVFAGLVSTGDLHEARRSLRWKRFLDFAINFSQLARNINCIEIASLSGLRWRSVFFLLINEENKLKTQVGATKTKWMA